MKNILRKSKIVIVDQDVTKILVKKDVQNIHIEDELSGHEYDIKRSPVKKSLQMVGN